MSVLRLVSIICYYDYVVDIFGIEELGVRVGSGFFFNEVV